MHRELQREVSDDVKQHEATAPSSRGSVTASIRSPTVAAQKRVARKTLRSRDRQKAAA